MFVLFLHSRKHLLCEALHFIMPFLSVGFFSNAFYTHVDTVPRSCLFIYLCFFWRSCLLQPTVVLCPPFSQQTNCSRLKIAFHASAPVSTITTVPTSNCSLLEETDRLDQCAAHTPTVSPPQNCTPTMWKLQICSCRGEEEALWWVFRWSLQWQQWFPSNGDFIPLT